MWALFAVLAANVIDHYDNGPTRGTLGTITNILDIQR